MDLWLSVLKQVSEKVSPSPKENGVGGAGCGFLQSYVMVRPHLGDKGISLTPQKSARGEVSPDR